MSLKLEGVNRYRRNRDNCLDYPGFSATPKDVMATMLLSFASRLRGSDLISVQEEIVEEWRLLNHKGLIEQKPPTWLTQRYLRKEEAG